MASLRSSFVVLLLAFAFSVRSLSSQTLAADDLHKQFANPPDDCRIMMRWWWFGPAVAKPEIRRELEAMKAEGIGGVEIANLYAQALDDPQTGFHNQPFLSDEHIEMLRYAAEEARGLGLRVDVTLGSGWPLGGPHIPVTQGAGLLRVETVKLADDANSVAVPDISAGEQLLAVFVAPSAGESLSLQDAQPVFRYDSAAPVVFGHGRLFIFARPKGEANAVFFIASRTGMVVKRPSVGAAGFVLDHYDSKATENHLRSVGDRLLQAFGNQPPYAVFSDSLEDYGSDWTGDFLREFLRRRGYDLTPYLPALIGDIGPKTAAIRHDWGLTLTELANDNFLVPIHSWAQKNHTLLRSQTYGLPPVTLSSNQYVDLPEGEGKADVLMWRHFSDLRWAASAGHLFGSNVISSETWTWLHSPAFRATPLDMKAEADLHFLQGINQLVGHGWPYSPESAVEPGWRMYAAGAFNDHNPWSFVMPDLARYLQRVSFALRQGKPALDVAILLPNDDAWATFHASARSEKNVTTGLGFNTAGSVFSIDEAMPGLLGETIIAQAVNSRLNVDFIDADAIDKVGIPYRILILPGVDRLPLATYRKIEEFARHGGIVIATRRTPSTAPGFADAESQTAAIRETSVRLFQAQNAAGHFLADENDLGALLTRRVQPGLALANPEIGSIHRILPDGELYFLANTSNHAQDVIANFQTSYKFAEIWDAMTGEANAVGDSTRISLHLEPYESRLVYLSNRRGGRQERPRELRGANVNIEIKGGWDLAFAKDRQGLQQGQHQAALHSWSGEKGFEYYSGQVQYRTSIDLAPGDLQPGRPLYLNFGAGTTVKLPSPLSPPDMRAYLESPVREAAEVFINGHRAGTVWHPPYSVRIDTYLKPGSNEIEITVGNTAINELSGRNQPDYRLLKDRYGDLFSPQGMDDLQPLPSGIVGPVRVTSTEGP